MVVSCVELANNDVICLRAIEVNTIPDLSITNYKSEEEIRKAYSELTKRTLGEVFQFYSLSSAMKAPRTSLWNCYG